VFGLAPLRDPHSTSDPASGPASDPDSGPEADGTTVTTAALDAGSEAIPAAIAGPGRVVPSTAYLVYLFKRGTFYPFVPNGHERRDTEEELKLKSLVADDLVVEADLDRWFPLWDLPVG
jgi:hypothetical protein